MVPGGFISTNVSDSDEFASVCPLFPIDPSESDQYFANDRVEKRGVTGFSLGASSPIAGDNEWSFTPPVIRTDFGKSLVHRASCTNPVHRKITPLKGEAGKVAFPQKESRKQKLRVDRAEADVLKGYYLNYHVFYDEEVGHFSFEFDDAKPGSDKKAVEACNEVRIVHDLPGRRTPVTATHNKRNPAVKQPFYGKVRPLVKTLFNYKCNHFGTPLTEEDTGRYVDGCIKEALDVSFKTTGTPQRSPRGVHEEPGGSSVLHSELLFDSDKENVSCLGCPPDFDEAVSQQFFASDDATAF